MILRVLCILLVLSSSAWARMGPLVCGGDNVAPAACTTEIDSLTGGATIVSVHALNQRGGIIATTSDTEICAIEVYVTGVPGGSRTIELRVGTSTDLSSSYVEGSVIITSADVNTWVRIPLDNTITGSTEYFWAVLNPDSIYNTRVEFQTYNPYDALSASTGDWVMIRASNNAGMMFKAYGN